MNELRLLTRIASRNIFASFLNVIIGGIILVGTLLFVAGGSLLGSMNSAMSRSITGSIGGDLQIYSDQSKDELALFGSWSQPDLTPMTDFPKIKQAVLGVDNVKSVIPMAVSSALVAYGNTLDMTLEKLRKAVYQRNRGDHSQAQRDRIESLKSHVRQIVSVIEGDYKKLSAISSARATDPQSVAALAHASSVEFWASFEHDPLGHLEFLENKIASLIPDADFVMLNYVGTDLDAYMKAFDRMQIVDGRAVPEGHRGMLLSKFIYENQFKLKVAHRLDAIHEALQDEGKTIAKDPDLQESVKENRTQTREIVLQLDPLSTRQVVAKLQKFLGGASAKEIDVTKLLEGFLATDDANFAARYKFFYAEIAPFLELYRVKPGDMLTIKAYTKSGFVEAVNIKIYGTFQFKGLEKSGLAGSMSLMDLMSFRDLYGYMTPEKIAESQRLEREAGVKVIDRDQAEAELFGGGAQVVQTGREKKINDQAELADARAQVHSGLLVDRKYTPAEIEGGVSLNAAVILKDHSKLAQAIQAIQDVSKRDDLDLRVVSWQKAAGMLGQFVTVAKVALYSAVFIIFVVGLVIINNAVMMATLQRVREIGTLRAIGAQRGFVLGMILTETMLLGLLFGTAGTLLGSGVIEWLHHIGIPAQNQYLYFFFSGPRLYPSLGAGNIVGAFVIILFVTAVSALYPAIIATRVTPVQAMQSDD